MSSEKFEDHEDDYRSYYQELRTVVKDKLPRLTGGMSSYYS